MFLLLRGRPHTVGDVSQETVTVEVVVAVGAGQLCLWVKVVATDGTVAMWQVAVGETVLGTLQ